MTYDEVGNIKTQEISSSARYSYVHDAWNRLVKVMVETQGSSGWGSSSGGTTLALGEYGYNGLHWRIMKRADVHGTTAQDPPDGVLDQQRVMVYAPPLSSAASGSLSGAAWQLVQEEVDDDWSPGSGSGTTILTNFAPDRRLTVMYGLRGGGSDDVVMHRVSVLDSGAASIFSGMSGNEPSSSEDYYHLTDP